MSAHTDQGARVYTIHVCPECGEHCLEASYDPERGHVFGHYHDPPEGWHTEDGPSREDPWFNAVAVEVVPKEALATAIVGGVEVAGKVRDANQVERRRLENLLRAYAVAADACPFCLAGRPHLIDCPVPAALGEERADA